MKKDLDAIVAYAEECIKVHPDGIFCINHRGVILFSNESFAKMVGTTVEKLVGSSVFRLFPSVNPFDVSFAERVGRGGLNRAEVPLARADGTKTPVGVTISSVREHNSRHHVAFCFVRNLGEFERMAHELEEEVAKRKEAQRELEETNERLRALLMADELTGAASRRFFIDEAERLLAVASDSDEKISLAILDVDLFKQINDRYGHLAGDQALQRIVAVIKANMRRTDLIARWGGDEFVILLSGTPLEGAQALAARMRKTIEGTDFQDGFSVTLSIGVAENRQGDGVDSLIARADEALYKAKRGGRNRFELVDDDEKKDQITGTKDKRTNY